MRQAQNGVDDLDDAVLEYDILTLELSDITMGHPW
jgi:hypothetical protein